MSYLSAWSHPHYHWGGQPHYLSDSAPDMAIEIGKTLVLNNKQSISTNNHIGLASVEGSKTWQRGGVFLPILQAIRPKTNARSKRQKNGHKHHMFLSNHIILHEVLDMNIESQIKS